MHICVMLRHVILINHFGHEKIFGLCPNPDSLLVGYTFKNNIKDLVLSIMLHAPLLLSLFARERGCYCFPGFCFSRSKHSIAWKEIITSRASVLFKFAILRYTNKRLTTDMAGANGLQRAIRPTRFFNIKKMAADICSTQCIMDKTGSLTAL